MRVFIGRGLAALAALGALGVGTPRPVTAQNAVPSFIEQGKTYVMAIAGSEEEVTVVDISTGGWIKVSVKGTILDEELWINLNHVPIIIEVPPGTTAPTRANAYVAAMKSDLRNLVVSQEMYFADNTTYAQTVSELRDFYTSAGVTITINAASGIGWNGTARHERSRRVCTISLGGGPAAVEGVPSGVPICSER